MSCCLFGSVISSPSNGKTQSHALPEGHHRCRGGNRRSTRRRVVPIGGRLPSLGEAGKAWRCVFRSSYDFLGAKAQFDIGFQDASVHLMGLVASSMAFLTLINLLFYARLAKGLGFSVLGRVPRWPQATRAADVDPACHCRIYAIPSPTGVLHRL